MEKYSIEKGYLGTGLDTPYCRDFNRLDVYSCAYWTAETKEEYERKEGIIFNWSYEDDLCKCDAWCDGGGFDYWVIKEQEENYVAIDVYLKKQPLEYTKEEILKLRDIIIEADQYFVDQLI